MKDWTKHEILSVEKEKSPYDVESRHSFINGTLYRLFLKIWISLKSYLKLCLKLVLNDNEKIECYLKLHITGYLLHVRYFWRFLVYNVNLK